MKKNCIDSAREFLHAIDPNIYNEMLVLCLQNSGIVHIAPDCVFLAIPHPERKDDVLVLFQCSKLSALWRLARMYAGKFEYVSFRRDFKNKYPEKRVKLRDFINKTSLVNHINHISHE